MIFLVVHRWRQLNVLVFTSTHVVSTWQADQVPTGRRRAARSSVDTIRAIAQLGPPRTPPQPGTTSPPVSAPDVVENSAMVPLLLAGVGPGGDGFDAAMRQMESCIADAQFVRGQVRPSTCTTGSGWDFLPDKLGGRCSC
jgi:hypothetical protein